MVFDALLPNTYPQSQEAHRKKKKPVSSGLWRACLASSLQCELGCTLNLSGLWDLCAVNSKACLVSVRLSGLLYSACVVEGLRGARNPAQSPLVRPWQGAASTQRNGSLSSNFYKKLSGLEVALLGLKRWVELYKVLVGLCISPSLHRRGHFSSAMEGSKIRTWPTLAHRPFLHQGQTH